MRANATTNYIGYIHKIYIDNLLKDFKEQFREEHPVFLKISAYYIKTG
ncbi:hypothetical protein J4526_02505 [Desulfurococcaceae archaeon MEX13E-LK6-19]|nr:hypothetical protein J4526_02505 [Desulfurococcaceae archaeon MEX13E-LK6-19]